VKLSDLRESVRSLAVDAARLLFETAAGKRPSAQAADPWRVHACAASLDAFHFLREEQSKAEGRRAQRLGMLADFVAGALEDLRAADALSRREADEAARGVTDPEQGGQVPLRTALARLPAIAERGRRAALDAAVREALGHTASLSAAALEAAADAAAALGFASYIECRAVVGGFDPRAVAAEGAQFLAATDAMYADVLDWWLRRTTGERAFPRGAEHHDLLHALHAAPLGGVFPAGRDLWKTLAGPFAATGLDPLADERIRTDFDERPAKVPGAAAFAVDPPDEVHLLWRPQGGLDDAPALLRALGEALHAAYADPPRPFEDHGCGDASSLAASGYLLESLVVDRGWLRRRFGVKDGDTVRVLALGVLARARLDAVSLQNELDLRSEGPGAAVLQRCAERTSAALGARWPQERCLRDVEPRFAPAVRLRGRALAVSAFEVLRERCDEDWWANPRAGAFLRGLFAPGRFEPPERVAEAIGAGAPSLARVASAMEPALGA